MASKVRLCAFLLLAGMPCAFAQSPSPSTTQTDSNQGLGPGYSPVSPIASPNTQPAGLRTTAQALPGGPPTTAQQAVGTFWEPLNARTPGHTVDGWTFYPMVTGATFFDDNVFATPTNRKSDWAFIVRPELAVTKSGQNYGIEAHAFVEGREYSKFSSEDQANAAASLGGTVMLNQDTRFQGRVQYVHAHEDRGVGDLAQTVFDKPVAYDQFDGAVALNHRHDRWWTSVGAAATVIHFSTPTVMGVPQDQSFRNGDIVAVPARVGYVVAPFTSVFVEGTPNSRQFDVSEFSSTGYRVVGGVLLEPGQDRRIRGEAFAGYMNQDYRGATFHDISTWTFGASLAFLLTDKLTMTLQGNRQALESALTCAGVFVGCGSSLIETWGGARFDLLVRPNLVVGAGATYLVDEVVNGNRTDHYLRPLFSVKYFPTPWLTLGFDYRNLNYDSTGPGVPVAPGPVPGYTRNVYLFSAHAKF
jgi:hypothetical protein